MYYTYLLIDPFTNKPFYVGKGKDNRAYIHEYKVLSGQGLDNLHLERKIKLIHRSGGSVKVQFLKELLTENEAFDLEISTIASLGIENLCNLTLGGDGGSPTDEVRLKISLANTGKVRTSEMREAMRQVKLGVPHSDSHREARSKSLLGRTLSESHRSNISESLSGVSKSEDHKKSLSDAKLKNPVKYWEGRNHDEDTKAKIRASVLKNIEERRSNGLSIGRPKND